MWTKAWTMLWLANGLLFTSGCGHGIEIIWNQRCQSSPRSLRAGVCWHGIPACALISCDATDNSRICVAVVRCTSRLISDARRLRSTRLFATCVRLMTQHGATCRCLHELGWPSSSRNTSHCSLSGCSKLNFPDLNWSKYSDHIQFVRLATKRVFEFNCLWDRGCIWNYMHLVNLSICNNFFTWSKIEPAFDYQHHSASADKLHWSDKPQAILNRYKLLYLPCINLCNSWSSQILQNHY